MRTELLRRMVLEINVTQDGIAMGTCKISICIPLDMPDGEIDEHVKRVMDEMLKQVNAQSAWVN